MYYSNKWIYICINNPFKTMWKIKGVFKPLKIRFSTHLTYPILCGSGYSFFEIVSWDVGWKDKWNTPRYEQPPYIWIKFWKLSLCIWWTGDEDYNYWEQALWYLYYYENISYGRLNAPDIYKAMKSWPWTDYETKKSTWNNNFLTNQTLTTMTAKEQAIQDMIPELREKGKWFINFKKELNVPISKITKSFLDKQINLSKYDTIK